jgi:stage II sporulation protein AA (anti-sigma F factor antagonist)
MTPEITEVTMEVAARDGAVRIVLEGEIDLANADQVGRDIASAITNRTTATVVDLTGITYLDSAGLHVLFDLAARLPTLQIDLELVAPPGSQVRRVMEISGLTKITTVSPLA